jgi:hypothetical protein
VVREKADDHPALARLQRRRQRFCHASDSSCGHPVALYFVAVNILPSSPYR